jgi:MFS family permease
MVLRVLLGALESVVGPGLSMLTAMFFTRSEQPFVHGVWYAGTGIASFFGGLIAYGIDHIRSVLAPWKARNTTAPSWLG